MRRLRRVPVVSSGSDIKSLPSDPLINCTCQDNKHINCVCRRNYCNCLIIKKIHTRKRCPICRYKIETDMFSCETGWFIGYFCNKCGLIGRISEIESSYNTILKQFKVHIKPIKLVSKVNGYQDYQVGYLCKQCAAHKYQGYIAAAVQQTLLTPLETIPMCSQCGK